MIKKIITKDEKSILIGRSNEEGKIMMVLNNFTITKNNLYLISTSSYLVNENAENNTGNLYPSLVEGFEFYKVKMLDEKTTTYSAEEVQNLFSAINREILLTGDFTEQFTEILNNALLMVVASENTFNIGGVEEWESI